MKLVVVERTLDQPTTAAKLSEPSSERQACFEMHRVRLLRSLVSLDGLRVICEYEAPDAESVRRANRKAGMPFDRVWTAEEYVVKR